MPSSLVLLLPLLAGYIFNQFCHRLHFRSQALSGHRLLLEAATSGMLLLGVARVFTYLVRRWHPDPLASLLDEYWPDISGQIGFAGTAAASLALAVPAFIAANLLAGIWHRKRVDAESVPKGLLRPFRRWWRASRVWGLSASIHQSGNALQKLLHVAATRARSERLTVGLTLSNGRIYAGFVGTSPNLHPEDGFVSIVPLMSGHRDKRTLRIKYDFAYPLEKLSSLSDLCGTVVALPVGEIQSAHLLDEDYYQRELQRLQQGDGGSGRTWPEIGRRLLEAVLDRE